MTGVGRFAARSAGLLAVELSAAVAVALLVALAGVNSTFLGRLDQAAGGAIQGVVTGNAFVGEVLNGVSDLGGTGMLLWLLVVAVAWLLMRGQPRLAVYVGVTALGALIIVTALASLSGFLRSKSTGLASSGEWAFPSGDALGSVVSYGVLILVIGPALGSGARRATATVAAVLVVANGVARIGLGVHQLVDLVAGWLIGLLWLALTVVALRHWRRDVHGAGAGWLPGDVPMEDVDRLRPVAATNRVTLSHRWLRVAGLAVGWVAVGGVLVGLGSLVTSLGSGSLLLQWDHTVSTWLAEQRSPVLSEVLGQVARLGGTPLVMTGYLVVAPLAVAAFRSWRPAVFLAVALLGETSLYLIVANIVGRARPGTRLNADVSSTTSFPSGHVAAALVLYGATAALVFAATQGWWRWIIGGIAVLVPATVALQRLYWGMHYLTDIAGAIVLAVLWTAIVWWVTDPARKGSPARQLLTASASR